MVEKIALWYFQGSDSDISFLSIKYLVKSNLVTYNERKLRIASVAQR